MAPYRRTPLRLPAAHHSSLSMESPTASRYAPTRVPMRELMSSSPPLRTTLIILSIPASQLISRSSPNGLGEHKKVSERNQSCRQGTGSASESRFTVPFIYTPSFLSSEISAILSLLVQLLMYSLFFALFIYVWLLRSNFARLYYLYQL